MKVLMINGSPNQEGSTYTALKEVEKQLNSNGIETVVIQIGTNPLRSCTGCMGCKESGKCVHDDGLVNECIKLLDEADGMVIGSPVHYASATGNISSLLDRVFFASNSDKRFKLGAAVVSCRRGGASATFDQLNKYFTISGMPIVSSQYWNSVHGNNKDEVVKDLEGMQTMRTLGNNMSWLLKAINLAKMTIELPEKEKKVRSDFIR